MRPSESILRETNRTFDAVDRLGRRLSLRRLTALDTLRLFKAAGPVLAQNEPWLSMAGLAFSVMEIDNVPVPVPINEAQIEALIDRLGEDGLAAAASIMNEEKPEQENPANVGNLRGTLS